MTAAKIEWTDRSDWNAVRGCSRVSEGCRHCYAETIAGRFCGKGEPFAGFAQRMPTERGSVARWTGKVQLIKDRLDLPLRWKKPARIFANSMFDMFHEGLHEAEIDKLFAVMALAPQHTFQVLTKRDRRMYDYFDDMMFRSHSIFTAVKSIEGPLGSARERDDYGAFPLNNVWLGVSVESREHLNRIDNLRSTPAAVRFLSVESLLERIGKIDLTGIHWVIVGGESGPGARPFYISWAYEIVAQCQAEGVACFVKQVGPHPHRFHDVSGNTYIQAMMDRKGGDPEEWPAELRVREFPKTASVASA
jgi:protein gp37